MSTWDSMTDGQRDAIRDAGRDEGGRHVGPRPRVVRCDFCHKPITHHAGSGKWNHRDVFDAEKCPAARAQPEGWLNG